MQELLRVISQHIDTVVQALSTLSAAVFQTLFQRRKPPIEKGKRWRGEEKARRRKAQHQLKDYIHNILRDPHITQIQIIGMNHPLKLEDIYVRLLIHPESTLRYTLDPKLREAEEMHDPNLLLQAAQKSLESRIDGAIDPDEAIRLYKRCVIVGDPGAGKTTLLRHLAIKSARNELTDLPSIPIYVQLNTFNTAIHKDLPGLITAQLDAHLHLSDTHDIHELLYEKIRDGHVLLLLDGLDETKIGMNDENAERSYIAMVDAIKKLAAMYPQLPIVVTVRTAGYQHHPKLQGFDELEVIDFRPEDSKIFVSKWFNASQATSKDEKIKDLNARLDRSLRIQVLASNPLILSLIAIVFEGHLELPERRADFYKQCVDVLQTRWDASRDIKRRREFSARFQPQLLQEVAWHFHNQGKHYFPVDELVQVIGKFLPTVDISESQSRDVLEQITVENGLLREQAHGYYGFSHLTFQEYFVTQYIIANNRQGDLLKHFNNPWWEEVLLLYVGSIHDVSSLLNILLGQDRQIPLQDDVFHSHLILAGRCLGEKPLVRDVALRDQVINGLFEVLCSTPYALTREQVSNTLAAIGGARINNRLLDLLSSNDAKLLTIRESVGWALGSSGERSTAHGLVNQLSHKESGRYVRIVIARALGMLGERSVIGQLLDLLSDEQEDIYVRQSIVLTLGVLGDQSDAVDLAQLLDRKNENPLVQQSIVVALGMLENRSVVPGLQNLLTNEQVDWHVRGSAAKSLGSLGAKEAIPTMLQRLEDNYDNTYVRGRIAAVLGTFSSEVVPVQKLITLLTDSSLNAAVRSSIAKTLGTIAQEEVAPFLLQLLTDERTDHDVRISAATALGLVGNYDFQAINFLNTLRFDPQIDINLRASVTAALGVLGARSVGDDLLELIKNTQVSQDILLHIVHALASLADNDNVDKQEMASGLFELLSSEQIDRFRGQNIIKLLCALEERSIVPSLFNLLSNSDIDRNIRQNAADALAQIANDEESFSRLFELLSVTDIVDDVFRALWAVSRHAKSQRLGQSK